MNRLILGRLRLASGLVLLAFVTGHLLSHTALLVSTRAADVVGAILLLPWRLPILGVILPLAFLWHAGNALVVLYKRRSLRLKPWEWW